MKNRFLCSLFTLSLTTIWFSGSVTAQQPVNVLSNGASVDGIRLDQYAMRWWQWTFSMHPSRSPVRDRTGKHCAVGQSGNVWFLAGGYGSSRINRRCQVPAGKYLFFPVINMLQYPSPSQRKAGSMTCARAKKGVAVNNDSLAQIEVTVNGVALANPRRLRLKPRKCFDLADGRAPSPVYPSATDGYWVMLPPLSAGRHTLKFRAVYNRPGTAYGRMVQDISYDLNVEGV